MADDPQLPLASGTSIKVAGDDVAGTIYQRVKVCWGTDGVANDVNATTPMPVAVAPASAVQHGQQTVNAVATQLTSKTFVNGCTIKADDDNGDSVYLGNSNGVTVSTGYRLKAGQSVFVATPNANLLWAIGGAAGQKFHVLGS